ncbi:MAG: hypothetical protein AVW06_03550 [Hadesarchaea archaeon DG-33-1]|nr:MAG: hypothetical protein AVW06_03550 [Hadesarchaea archaeon DG-33-1]
MLDKVNERAILAEHGRWIERLRYATRTFDQRLTALEHRMSVLEGHLSELVKVNRKLDAQLTSAADQLSMLSSRFEVLAKHLTKIGKTPRIIMGAEAKGSRWGRP